MVTDALFCILVASICVINVMLSSVVRRSREFAIRIAMGARHRDIVLIVLAESFSYGIIGSILGIIGAGLISPLICDLLSTKIIGASSLQPSFGLRGLIIPVRVCGLSSLLAGVIPALRTLKLDILPVLRAE